MSYQPRRQLAPMRSPRKFEAAMRRRNVSVSDLARLAQLNRSSVSLIRSGKRTPSEGTARLIERALDVPHGDLFDFGDGSTAAPDAESAS